MFTVFYAFSGIGRPKSVFELRNRIVLRALALCADVIVVLIAALEVAVKGWS